MSDLSIVELFEREARVPVGPISFLRDESVPDLDSYAGIVLFFSGGKDSVACALHLLELGVPAARIELHHHLVDGAEGSELMDWPCTEAYCKAFAAEFSMRYVQSWRVGGLEAEMLRENAQTRPVAVPMPDGSYRYIGGERSEFSTRRKFPQVSADLRVRWCSSSAKIDVGSRYLCNNPAFSDGRKWLVVTGERAQESTNRARYQTFEPHRSDNRRGARVDRWIDHWRPVHGWSEQEVWALVAKHRLQVHPCYWLGYSRGSCRNCVFNGPDEWATIEVVDPNGFERLCCYEDEFGVTIHRSLSLRELAQRGTPFANATSHWREVAMGRTFDLPMRVDPWVLPPGAFRKGCGPT